MNCEASNLGASCLRIAMPTLSLITTLNYLKSGACLKLLSKQGGKKRWWIGLKIREGVGLRLIAQPDYARTRP